jgi:hypothetical protein
MQILWFHPDTLSGPFERSLKIGLLLQQNFVSRVLVLLHFGAHPA